MHDLNTIIELNNEAVEKEAKKPLAEGKFVVLEYSGLHFTGSSAFDTEVEANAYAMGFTNRNPSARARVFSPTN